MTDAVDTLINEIAKPLLGARHTTVFTYTANEGSQKVFLKNGFSVVRVIPNYTKVKGYQRDLAVLERHD
jgi:RimJ/RimL family protein N-acetyltransferase